ncbi:MAG: hypothetical protein F7C33_01705 [Desulfurococcales archaeon]|nr:hypothetical protein [Desulfurococcales archaeon]
MRRSRKPLVGAGSIILAFILALASYWATRDPLLAAVLAGFPTFIAPAYYAWKMDPVKSLAASVLASMASGSLAWIAVKSLGGDPRESLNPLLAYTLSFATGGLAGHLSASAYFMNLLGDLSTYSPDYPFEAACFLATASSTVLGLAFFRSIRRPGYLASPSLLLAFAFSLGMLALALTAG